MIKKASTALAVALAAAFGFAGSSMAFNAPLGGNAPAPQNSNIVLAHVDVNVGVGFWSPRRDGRRCGWRDSRCRHYYQGYWYERPWWVAYRPAPYQVYGSRHVQWCFDHYRSYNPANNSWRTYSGQTRQCISPYRY